MTQDEQFLKAMRIRPEPIPAPQVAEAVRQGVTRDSSIEVTVEDGEAVMSTEHFNHLLSTNRDLAAAVNHWHAEAQRNARAERDWQRGFCCLALAGVLATIIVAVLHG